MLGKDDGVRDVMAKILIVDDEEMTLEMLSTFLELSGHQPLTAMDTQQGWSVLGYEQPQAILLDIQLPDKNGLEMCRELRQDERTVHLPIVMISAHAPPMIEQAMSAGADEYLAKPIKLKTLQATLDSLL